MTRRRVTKTARRARWTLTAGAAPGLAIVAWTHHTWAGATTCLTIWAVIAATRLLRHRAKPRPAPSASWAAHEAEPHCVYHSYGWLGQLRYVGLACDTPDRDVHDRIAEHEDRQAWWRQEIRRTRVVARYPNLAAAEAKEAYDIHTLNPPRNRTHKTHALRDCPTIRAAWEVSA